MGKMYEMLKTMKLLGGTGGTGPIDYDNLENLPTMNGNTIKGEMTGSDLGLQDELTTEQLAAVNSGITSEDVEQISMNKNNISTLNQTKIGASDYATQNTGGTVRVWTTTSGGETTLHIANEAP